MSANLALIRPVTHPAAEVPDWLGWLQDRLDHDWRPDEWKPDRLLFEGNPDNDSTNIWRCQVEGCGTMVRARGARCESCARDARAGRLDGHTLRAKRLVGRADQPRCQVATEEGCCERESHRSGLCNAHDAAYRRYQRKEPGLTVAEWQRKAAPSPLPHRGTCIVIGCNREQVTHQMCMSHRFRKQWDAGSRSAVIPALRNHQFWLGGLTPLVQNEVLFALQARDKTGKPLDPTYVRLVVQHLAGVKTLCGMDIAAISFGGVRNSTAGRSLLGSIQHTLEHAYREFSGDDPSQDDVWDAAAMGLWSATHRRYDAYSGSIDFTTVRQPWLREVLKEWARSVRPDVQTLRINLKAFTIASGALARRPGAGMAPSRLDGADMTAIVHAIRDCHKVDGEPYATGSRIAFMSGWFNVLDFARSSSLMDAVPGSFSRARHHKIRPTEANEEQAGRALPNVVVRQLDEHLHLLSSSHRGWNPETSRLYLLTAYTLLRDTGRRLGEVVTLRTGCVEVVDGSPQLVYDNHKAGRNGRRLPITQELADVITSWDEHRSGLPLAGSALPWLFPSPMHAARGRGHIQGDSLATSLRKWVRSIPQIDGDLLSPDGSPLPFDRSLVTAHAFRHTYAQRHADAGVPVDVLRDLMDHRSVDTTMGYYQVSLKCKREAVKTMSALTLDRLGRPAPVPAARYEVTSVAVPFGGCTEPANVKAGGGACHIRFQCSGCNFYRPDPSYLPAIEDHARALKTDRETAHAIGTAAFVTDNLDAQIDSFGEVASTMRHQLDQMDDDERQEIEEASRTLRKARAGAARRLLPLTVVTRPEERS